MIFFFFYFFFFFFFFFFEEMLFLSFVSSLRLSEGTEGED